jgi:hypothetical protein
MRGYLSWLPWICGMLDALDDSQGFFSPQRIAMYLQKVEQAMRVKSANCVNFSTLFYRLHYLKGKFEDSNLS